MSADTAVFAGLRCPQGDSLYAAAASYSATNPYMRTAALKLHPVSFRQLMPPAQKSLKKGATTLSAPAVTCDCWFTQDAALHSQSSLPRAFHQPCVLDAVLSHTQQAGYKQPDREGAEQNVKGQ